MNKARIPALCARSRIRSGKEHTIMLNLVRPPFGERLRLSLELFKKDKTA